MDVCVCECVYVCECGYVCVCPNVFCNWPYGSEQTIPLCTYAFCVSVYMYVYFHQLNN